MWEGKWKVRWICEFTWDCSSSKAKFKAILVLLLDCFGRENYMPIRKDRRLQKLWIIALFKGESLESENSSY